MRNANLGRSLHSMWRIDGFSPQDMQDDGWIFHNISWFFAHKKLINPSQELFLCCWSRIVEAFPQLRQGEILASADWEISIQKSVPREESRSCKTALFCSINNRNAAFFYSNDKENSHTPGLQCMTTTTPTSTSSSSGSGKSLSAAFGWIEKTRWSRWREATRFIQRLFSNHQLLGSFRAQGEWLLSKGVFAKVESQLFNSFYWNQHFLTEILKGSTSLDLHYLMRVVASDIGARSLMLDLETSALELGGSSFKAPEKCSFPCHVEAWEHFAAIYNPSVSSFQDWHTTKKKQKKLKYILWVLLESWHFRKELVLKAKWKAKQRAHSPWLQILHALEMKGSASYYFHIFNFKSFWPKKIQVTKEAVPSFTS